MEESVLYRGSYFDPSSVRLVNTPYAGLYTHLEQVPIGWLDSVEEGF
jgi:hypothetical protein